MTTVSHRNVVLAAFCHCDKTPNQQLTGRRFIWFANPTYSPTYSTMVLACGKADYHGELQMVHEAAHTVDRKQWERQEVAPGP